MERQNSIELVIESGPSDESDDIGEALSANDAGHTPTADASTHSAADKNFTDSGDHIIPPEPAPESSVSVTISQEVHANSRFSDLCSQSPHTHEVDSLEATSPPSVEVIKETMTDDRTSSPTARSSITLEHSSSEGGKSRHSSDAGSSAQTSEHSTTAPSREGFSHARVKSQGPSLLEQVVSKTRPAYLPPKQKGEDLKHLSDWESMMKQSRMLEDARRLALQQRRIIREEAIESQIPVWEREIIPDWKVVYREPRLRKLWWEGIPAKLRGGLWAKAIGNPLALGKDSYRSCTARARRAIATGALSPDVIAAIDADIGTTLPSVKLFLPEIGPMHNELKELLLAWMASRTDEGLGFYVPGVARLGAMLLINMSNNEQAFVALRNYLERGCPRAFYGGNATKEDLEAYYRIFDTLLADYMPKVYFNFKQHQISPSFYLPDWLGPAFVDHLPFEACARVWDVLVLEGDSFLYRAAIAILGVIESRLFFPDRQELLHVLSGDHKAALDVALRNGMDVRNGKYSMYGVDEETLWERLRELDEWWKDSTWTRLLQRELPDA